MTSETSADRAGYARTLPCRAPRQRVFDAVATLDGLRAWWTPIAAGSARAGGTLTFGFEGLDEAIVMHVDEVSAPSRVRWTCREHTGASGWVGTGISFELSAVSADECSLAFRHLGVAPADVAAGWERFLASLVRLVESGAGDPYRAAATSALAVARAYHAAWTSGNVDDARRYLDPDLRTDVPLNTYESRDDFADAVARFGGLADRVDLLAEFGSDTEALLLYDMHTRLFGTLRVAEQFTVRDGLIHRIRHVHDTAVLRAAA